MARPAPAGRADPRSTERGSQPVTPARRVVDEPGARFQERPRAGGIQFDRAQDDDDDLAEYMNPDDLPPRSPKGS